MPNVLWVYWHQGDALSLSDSHFLDNETYARILISPRKYGLGDTALLFVRTVC